MSQQQRNALPIGEKLQNYRIEGVLGSGGFGITYMGVESVTERKVAIKEFMPSNIAVRDRDSRSIHPISESERNDFDWGLDRFRQEAKVLITLIHPNIVPVLNYFEANGTGYLVMAYQEGDSLAALLRPNKTLAQSEIDEILMPTLDGLATIHDAGFLHRDIKPDNIFIRSDGTPVIIDFGSARLALSQHTRGLTAIVSEGYAPFEQYQNDGNQGPWSDIYALGATLYRCITGRRPTEATARIAAAVKGSPDPLTPTGELAGPGYNAALLTAIDASLAVDETQRPQDAAAMRAMLIGEVVPSAAGAALLAGATPSSETMLVGDAAATATAAQKPLPDNTLRPDAGIGAASGATVTGRGVADPSAERTAAATTAPVPQSSRPRKLLWPAVAIGVMIAGGASAYVAIEKPWEPEQVAAVKTGKDALKTADPTDAEVKRKAEEEKRRADEARRDTAKREADRKAEEAKRQAADAEARRKAEAAEADKRRQAAEAETRKRADEAARKNAADAEAKRKVAADAEAKRKAAADAEAKRKAADDAKRKEAAEAQRQADEAEARRKAAEAEAKRQADARRQAAEAEVQRKAAIEARRKAAADAARKRAADETRRRAQEAQRKAAIAEARRKAALDAARKQALDAQKRKTYAERVEERRRAREARQKRLEAARKAAAERRKKQLAARNTGGIASYLPGRRVSYLIQNGRGEERWGMTISFSAGGGAFLSCNYQDMFGRYGACDGYIEGRARWTARGNSVCVRFRGGKQHCFGAVKRGAGWSLIPRVRGARLRGFR